MPPHSRGRESASQGSRSSRHRRLLGLLTALVLLAAPASAQDLQIQPGSLFSSLFLNGVFEPFPPPPSAVAYFSGADTLDAQLLFVPEDISGVLNDTGVRFELVAFDAAFVEQDRIAFWDEPVPKEALGAGLVIQPPLSSPALDAWAAKQRSLGYRIELQATIDPDDLIAELDETNNTEVLAGFDVQLLPLSDTIFFGGLPTTVLMADVESVLGPCSPATQVRVNAAMVEWLPSNNGQWDPLVLTVSPGQCADASYDGLLFDLDSTTTALGVNATGSLGGLPVTVDTVTLGLPVGALANSVLLTLPERHSYHLDDPAGLPEVRGRRDLTLPVTSPPVTDFANLKAGISSGFFQVSGLPFALDIASFTVEDPQANGEIDTTHYAHDYPYAATDPRNALKRGVRSNDRRFQAYDTSATETFTLGANGIGGPVSFLASTKPGRTHFPRTKAEWPDFSVDLQDGDVVAGAPLGMAERYEFEQRTACVDCPASGGGGPLYDIQPEAPPGLGADGAVVARTAQVGANAVWGPWTGSRFVFERLADDTERAVIYFPGFRLGGSGGESPEPVTLSLLGMRDVSLDGPSLVPGALHRLGSVQAGRGNHFLAGVTVGPQLYRTGPQAQPVEGEGALLDGNDMDVGFGGLPAPQFENVVGNVGNKYVVRPGGVTGVFNTSAPPNPTIYGYEFLLYRFAFRQVSNTLDPDTWIDGTVSVPLPGEFDVVFESLDLLCTGDIGEGLVIREACDQMDNNGNAIEDENCDEVLGIWEADFEVLTMAFVPDPPGTDFCAASDRVMQVGSTVDLVAFSELVGLVAKWRADGTPFDETVTGGTDQVLDGGFDMALGNDVALTREQGDASGWFRFFDASVPVPFWDAIPVGARVQNLSPVGAMASILGREGDAVLDDDNQPNSALAAGVEGSTSLESTYTWGATGFDVSLPVYYQSSAVQFFGETTSRSLIVLEATAGTDFITPTETKVSFGASAQFDQIEFANLPISIDLSDPTSLLQLDTFLGGNLLQSIVGNLADEVNGMNDVLGNNLDGFIEQGILGAIQAGAGTEFTRLSDALGVVYGAPGQLVEQVATGLDDLTKDLLVPLTADAESGLDTALGGLDTLLSDARNMHPDPPAFGALETARDQISTARAATTAILGKLDVLDETIAAARENIGGGAALFGEVSAAVGDAQGASGDIITLVGSTVGLGAGACSGNPIIDKIDEVADRVRQVQQILEGIDLDAIADQMKDFAEVDLSQVAQAEQQIQDLAKDIADRITEAEQAVSMAIGCPDTLGYASFGNDLVAFDGDLQADLGSLVTAGGALETVLDNILGPGGLLEQVEDQIGGARSRVADHDEALGIVEDAIDSALDFDAGSPPEYPFPAANATEVDAWLAANLGTPGNNLVADLRGSLTAQIDVAIDAVAFEATAGLSMALGDFSSPTPADVETQVTDLLMNDGVVEAADGVVTANLTALSDKTNSIQLLVFDQINNLLRSLIEQQAGDLAGVLENESSVVSDGNSDWNMPTFKMDGWGLIQGDDLQQLHVGLMLSVPGAEDKDTFNLEVSLDVTRWTANGKDQGCAGLVPNPASRLDVVIAAYNLPFRLGASEANIRKVFFGFTLDEGGGVLVPVQVFGGLAVDGGLDFQVVQVLDPAFVFGGGDIETYIGASAQAIFDTTSISVAFLVGRICNNDPLLVIDPQAGEFIDFPPSGGFTGGYVRGSASTSIINYGCPLQIGAGVDVGNWLFVGPPTVFGGIMGGGIFGKAACIVSIRGQLTMVISFADTLATFAGETFFVGGLGFCSPSSWSTRDKSRKDDIFCGTVDALFAGQASVDLESLFGGGGGDIQFKVDPPQFGAIH